MRESMPGSWSGLAAYDTKKIGIIKFVKRDKMWCQDFFKSQIILEK